MDLFVHDDSFYAEQTYGVKKNTTGTEKKRVTYYPVRSGRCRHEPKHKAKDCPDREEMIFDHKALLKHLQAKRTYAPYQISKDDTVKWICIDVDAYDSASDDDIRGVTLDVAKTVVKKLGPKSALVEDSGSKGYHIWILFNEPLETRYAYALGHSIISQVTPRESINLEVYPKQTSNRVFGNTVKLPLGVHQKTGERCWFVDPSFTVYSDQWQRLREVKRVSTAWVKKNVAPVERPKRHDTGPLPTSAWTPMCLTKIMNEGCSEGIRDAAAFRIACYLRDKGIPEVYASDLLEKWNTRNEPPLDSATLELKLESAYTNEYPWMPCDDMGFDKHCSSTCTFFKRKVQRRWHKPDTDPRGIISYE